MDNDIFREMHLTTFQLAEELVQERERLCKLQRETAALLRLVRGAKAYHDIGDLQEFNCELLDSIEAQCKEEYTFLTK
jgi:hypothetical protein